MQTVAIDLDGMLFSSPRFFRAFFPAMQAAGNKVGILTGRPHFQKDSLTEQLKEVGIDVLFDDFQCDDPKMLAEFFSINQTTIPFTSWAYQG
jgi:ribonucleotide monophosphatase NagD (HAD superfamily)